jgi:hypothetical protein
VFRFDATPPRAAQALLLRTNREHEDGFTWWVDSRRLDSTLGSAWWHLEPGPHTVRFAQIKNGKGFGIRPARFLVLPQARPCQAENLGAQDLIH